MDVIRRKILISKIESLPAGKSAGFQFGGVKGIAYNDGGMIKAYVNRCTHMGGVVAQCGDAMFRCGMHHAEFDARTGARLAGQAPEGSFLKPIDVVIEDGCAFAILEIVDEFA